MRTQRADGGYSLSFLISECFRYAEDDVRCIFHPQLVIEEWNCGFNVAAHLTVRSRPGGPAVSPLSDPSTLYWRTDLILSGVFVLW